MNRPLALVMMVVLAVLAAFVLLGLLSYEHNQVGDASPPGSNLVGGGGAYIAYYLIGAWGVAAFLVPTVMLGYAWALWREADLDNLGRRLAGALLVVLSVSGLAHLVPLVSGEGLLARWGEWLLVRWDQMQLKGFGGSLGNELCGAPIRDSLHPFPGGLLRHSLEPSGAALVLIAVLVLGVILMDIGIAGMLRRWWRSFKRAGERRRLATAAASDRYLSEPFVPIPPKPKGRATTSMHEISRRIADEEALPPDAAQLVEKIRSHRRALEQQGGENAAVSGSIENATMATSALSPAGAVANPTPDIQDRTLTAADDQDAQPTVPMGAATMPDSRPDSRPEAPPAAPRTPTTPKPPIHLTKDEESRLAEDAEYILPPVDLLEAMPSRPQAEHEKEKNQIAKQIEEVFSHFNIGVQVVDATRGPVVTQYEIRLLDQAMRVGKVEGYEKDLAMKLGTEGIRIVAPLPNKTTIGVEVPNRVKAAVVMRDLVEEFDPDAYALPIILGRDVIGRPIISDLAKMPHLLVAGATGMGKSVCMNAMICSILLFKTPNHVKFIMVDPKMVELAGYEDIPHLLAPPITDMTRAHAALEWACRTMDERYEALKSTGVRDIKSFNELGEAEIRMRLGKKDIKLEDLAHDSAFMSYIVVLVDEYADLMMVNKEVEKSIVRLAAKSRACGIHVILTTQRPSADVVTGLIKSNLPSRICFRVVDKSNSRVVLDVSGAENLLGKGDMLFLQPGTSQPIRGQGVWLKDSEINAIVAHAKEQGAPEYNTDVVDTGAVAMMEGEGSGSVPASEWLKDRQFHEAVQSMYRYNKTGADFFRRKCNVGYNKATQYVEQLADLGFLSPAKGTASREILKTFDDWLDLLKKHGHTWDEDDDIYHDPIQIRS